MDFIYFQNKKIFYRYEGEGMPVVLVHGFGENGEVWRPQIDFLKKNFTLIVPDLPGSGKSEMVADPASVELYGEIIKSIYDNVIKARWERFCLVGHSMGGYIALAFAERYQNLLCGLCLFHSSAFADTEEKIATRRKSIEFILKNGSVPFLKSSVPNLFAPATRNEKPELPEQLFELAKEIQPAALIQYYRAMIERPSRMAVLKKFAKPAMFIIGKFDQAVPLTVSLEQCHVPDISFVHILENSGHMGMWEQPDQSNKLLSAFFTELADDF